MNTQREEKKIALFVKSSILCDCQKGPRVNQQNNIFVGVLVAGMVFYSYGAGKCLAVGAIPAAAAYLVCPLTQLA